MTTHNTDPLQELVDKGAASINRDRLLGLLKPFVRFDSEGKLNFLPPHAKLDARLKLQIALAATKARSLIMDTYKDGLVHKEIIDLDLMPVGTAKSTTKNLTDSRKIRKLPDGRYVVPDYLVEELADQLSSN